MHTLKIGILKDMFNQLPKYAVTEKTDIGVWEYTKGIFNGDDGYDMEDFKSEIKTGDRHYATYDCAHFFKANVTVPQTMDGKTVKARLQVGGEALVKCNGKYVGGCTTRDYMPDRADVTIGICKAGDVLNFEIEATVDSMNFCDEHLAGAEYQECLFGETSIYTVDDEVEGYIFDIEVAFDCLEHIKDEHIKSKVYAAIDDSLHIVDYDFEPDVVRKSIKEARKLYNERISSINWTAQSDIILTGHSHIDVAWLWRIQESIRKSARTFTNVVSLMDQYPEMTFGQSQAVLYDMTKRNYPEIYNKIKEKVANGQWDICGNVWVEADTNIASGESLIRQVLYGTEFFRKEFGKVSKTYWLPDCFGFTAALPQIIKGCGMENFITSKLTYNDTTKFPYNMFMWRGNNGDVVYAHLMRPSYNCRFRADEIMCYDEECNNKSELSTAMGMYGYGDGGGGPTREMLERGRRLKHFPGMPECNIGHVDDFFKTYHGKEEELPVWNGEMYYENHRGTFTSQAFVKKNNRKCEYLLTRNELMTSFLEIMNSEDYPKDEIEADWRVLMTNQFHDILPGSSIHEVFEDCKKTYKKLTENLNNIKSDKLKSLSNLVKADKDTITVFNFTSTVSNEAIIAENIPEGLVVENIPTLRDGENIIFLSPVPAMGYSIFKLVEGNYTCENGDTSLILENDYLYVEIDENGQLTSVHDKINRREALAGNGNILTVSLDKCIHETAWNLELNYKKKMWELSETESICVTESNEVRKVIRVIKKFNKSTITQDYILYANSDSVIFDTSVDWHETDKVLKAGFEVAVIDSDATYDIAHGAFKRPTHYNTAYDLTRFEVAAHKWADLSEGGYGCSIINDCKYGYDIHDSHVRITLMRAPTCPDPIGDHGINTFRYEFHPHKNDWRFDTVQKANTFNIPPVSVYNKNKTDGKYENTAFINISEKNVSVEAFKKAQDGNGYILRVVEDEQKRCCCDITLPFNIKEITECNMIEEYKNDIVCENNMFSFYINPFEVKTFRIKV